jgi:ABC-type phosphate transport system auxiliary subunit
MSNKIIVTTGDLKNDYDVIGPVYFSVSNKGLFGSQLGTLIKKYKVDIEVLKKEALMSPERTDWGVLWGEFSAGQNDFDKAFYIAVQELKSRAEILNADAIVSMRQDIDLDTNGFQYFYLQMYGTAVKFK